MGNSEVLLLEPHFTHNIWGGTKLRTDFGYPVPGDDIGECWGIAAHPNGDARVREGRFSGMTLSELYREHPELFGADSKASSAQQKNESRFPLLVKIIDAHDDLSIQVHPDDAYASAHENGASGKAECWYILEADPGASIVLGHHAKTREELETLIKTGDFKTLIQEIPVEKGDFIIINPGTVHAIKGGITLLETQQNSDVTYRLYDYDRLWKGEKRPLHLKQSVEVITVPSEAPEDCMIKASEIDRNCPENKLSQIFEGPFFKVFRLKLDGKAVFSQDYPFLNVSVTEGEAVLSGHRVKKGDHLILPCGFGEVTTEGRAEFIASTSAV